MPYFVFNQTHEQRTIKMLYQWLFTIKFISLLSFAAGNNSSNIPPLDYRYQCLNQSSVPLSITYQINLKDLFTYLSDSASTNSFGHINLDDDHQNMVYGLYLCRGDVNNTLCNSCVQNSTTLLNQHCPNSTSAIMWLPFCVVRYSNQKFFGKLTIKPRVPMFDATQNFSGEFDSDARILMNGLIQKGSEAPLMFGTHVCNINGTQTRHALVQCSRDITREECRTCLRNMVEEVQNCCMEKKVWHVFSPSCVVMYQTQPFFFIDTLPQQAKVKGKRIIAIIVVIVIVVVTLWAVSTYHFWYKNRENDKNGLKEDDKLNSIFFEDQSDKEETMNVVHLPMIPLNTILKVTNSFSDEYKLGKGGFGSVYKGVLRDGRQIAVKRLSKTSIQGVKEFKNEVMLIAKLQHRNLVKLLAFCIERDEKLLIYEYMPNSSLDFHLFGMEKRMRLNWKQLSNIINGVAKGLLYLHEDSRLRIIHRDLKAGNILLDHEMNPKISDFGLARIFEGDKREANTNRVVGTYGYMAPEYAMEGVFSVKSDVFSFGTLLLEIISGKRISEFNLSDHGQSLLIYAWNLWCEGRGLELMDPLIEKSCVNSQVLKCIQIGLLCVQEDAIDRPTMSGVVYMLSSDKVILPNPKRPAFSVGRNFLERGSSSDNWTNSINKLTLSEVTPR